VSAGSARIVHEAFAAWQERDPDRIAGLIAPEVEFLPLRAQLESTSYVGEAGMRQMWEDLDRDWAQLEFDLEETHHDGDDVVVIGRISGRSHEAGAEIDTRIGWHWIVQAGRITFARSYSDPGEALRAAGLAETTARDVAVVRRHYAAFNRDDVAAIAETLHPEVEILGSDERGGGRLELYTGREEATAFFKEIKEAFANNDVAVLSLDARPGRVEASVRLHGTVRATERSGSLPAVHFFATRDGLIARIETYRPDWRETD
jgi:ketosteroid isomerase-like protein